MKRSLPENFASQTAWIRRTLWILAALGWAGLGCGCGCVVLYCFSQNSNSMQKNSRKKAPHGKIDIQNQKLSWKPCQKNVSQSLNVFIYIKWKRKKRFQGGKNVCMSISLFQSKYFSSTPTFSLYVQLPDAISTYISTHSKKVLFKRGCRCDIPSPTYHLVCV